MILDSLNFPLAFDAVKSYPIASIFLAWLFYTLGVSIYRVTLHPLSKFPGPKLAAITYWYESYYDVWLEGQYIWKIMELHEKYGPIIRVNPNDVHIKDPDYYSEIYHSKSYRTDRDEWYNLSYLGEGVPFTREHDVHLSRRQALSPFFSMQAIRMFEYRISDIVKAALKKLENAYETGQVILIRNLLVAITTDVITKYSFGRELGLVADDDACQGWVNLVDFGVRQNSFNRHFPLIAKTLFSLPESLVAKLNPGLYPFVVWNNKLRAQVRDIIVEKEKGLRVVENDKTVIHDLLDSSLSPADKAVERIKDEALTLIGAGAETTSATLTRLTVHILSNPKILMRLQAELDQAIPNVDEFPTAAKLQQLPYLAALCEEGIRISLPVLGRNPRVFRDRVMQFREWTIPTGVPISQSAVVALRDPDIFPDPETFNPDRWLDNPGLGKYQVGFSKGRRGCVGTNLAYVELHMIIATLFRKFDLELYETSIEDVEPKEDRFISMAPLSRRKPKVTVKGLRK